MRCVKIDVTASVDGCEEESVVLAVREIGTEEDGSVVDDGLGKIERGKGADGGPGEGGCGGGDRFVEVLAGEDVVPELQAKSVEGLEGEALGPDGGAVLDGRTAVETELAAAGLAEIALLLDLAPVGVVVVPASAFLDDARAGGVVAKLEGVQVPFPVGVALLLSTDVLLAKHVVVVHEVEVLGYGGAGDGDEGDGGFTGDGAAGYFEGVGGPLRTIEASAGGTEFRPEHLHHGVALELGANLADHSRAVGVLGVEDGDANVGIANDLPTGVADGKDRGLEVAARDEMEGKEIGGPGLPGTTHLAVEGRVDVGEPHHVAVEEVKIGRRFRAQLVGSSLGDGRHYDHFVVGSGGACGASNESASMGPRSSGREERRASTGRGTLPGACWQERRN